MQSIFLDYISSSLTKICTPYMLHSDFWKKLVKYKSFFKIAFEYVKLPIHGFFILPVSWIPDFLLSCCVLAFSTNTQKKFALRYSCSFFLVFIRWFLTCRSTPSFFHKGLRLRRERIILLLSHSSCYFCREAPSTVVKKINWVVQFYRYVLPLTNVHNNMSEYFVVHHPSLLLPPCWLMEFWFETNFSNFRSCISAVSEGIYAFETCGFSCVWISLVLALFLSFLLSIHHCIPLM